MVEFAGHRLQGPAGTWWASYQSRLPEGTVITLKNFCDAFRAHFIPTGLLKINLEQFLKLEQGNKSVLEHTQEFEHLAQYATGFVDTDEKKKDCYMRGLSAKMQDKFSHSFFPHYNTAVSCAITTEEKMNALKESLKGKEMPAAN